MAEPIKTIEIDVRGQVCPSTMLVALDNLNRYHEELHSGKVRLLIRTDNRDATSTIPGTAESMGYEIQVLPLAGFYEIVISSPA
jgi:TusA-related sulfurtransferase